LAKACAGVFPGHAPESAIAQHLQKIGKRKTQAVITFAAESQNGVGSSLHAAVNHAREMHSQERKTRVWDRIDQVPYQRTALRNELIILATEGQDLQARFDTTQPAHAI